MLSGGCIYPPGQKVWVIFEYVEVRFLARHMCSTRSSAAVWPFKARKRGAIEHLTKLKTALGARTDGDEQTTLAQGMLAWEKPVATCEPT